MMEMLRNSAKSWVTKILLGLLVLSFGIWGVNDFFSGTRLFPTELATVGKRSIDGQQFTARLQDEIQRQAKQFNVFITLDDARRAGLDRQVLDQMIATAAIEEQAAKMGIKVGATQIAHDIANDKQFQNSDGTLNKPLLLRVLEENGTNEAGYILRRQTEEVRRAVLTSSETVVGPKILLEAQNAFVNATRDARYFTFKITEADAPAPTDADLKKQYELTPAAYTAPEYRSVAVFTAEPSDLVVKFTPTDDELKAGLEKYRDDYVRPERRAVIALRFPDVAAAQAAKQKLDAGADIMAMAAEMKVKQEDFVFADRSQGEFLDGKVGEVAFATALGTVSDPVESTVKLSLLEENRITLVKVTNILPEVMPALENVKAELSDRIKRARAEEEVQAVYAAVEEARANQDKFEDISTKAGLPFKLIKISASGLGVDDKPVEIPGGGDLLKAAFGSDVGVENDALTTDGGYLWYEVREVVPSALRPFDTVKDKVTADWRAEKLRGLAGEKAKALVERAKSGTTLDALATELGTTVKAAAGLKRGQPSDTFDGVANTALFAVPDQGFAWSLEPDGLSARVMKVEKVDVPALALAKEETKLTKDALANMLQGDMARSFADAARVSVGATVNEEMWQQISNGVVTPAAQ
jgi:peptidyl-prolyl cis-trans isomerase D